MEEEYCDICGTGKYSGYMLMPCAHKLCNKCKGDGKFEKCLSCNTRDVEIYKEDDIMENEKSEDDKVVMEILKNRLDNSRSMEESIIEKIEETERRFKSEMESLKRKRDQEILKSNIALEEERKKNEISRSKIGLFDRLIKNGSNIKRALKLTKTPTSGFFIKDKDMSKPKFVIGRFGSKSDANGLFRCPIDLTSNSKGQILVCDSFNHRIQIFKQDGTFIKSFGSKGNEPGQFRYPIGITIDNQDNIYVSDGDNHRIQIFNDDGSKIIKIIGKDDCKYGIENGEFYHPRGIFINPQNQDILVADSGNHRVQIFDKELNFIRKFGSEGNGKGELDCPIGMVMNSQNQILVSDYLNNRIQIFDYEWNHLRFVGNQNGELKQPCQLCVDHIDNLYVGTWTVGFPMQIFDKDGKLVNSLKSKTQGRLFGVNINSIDGSLAVSDSQNHVVYIY